jgi:hypothetical protein
MKVKIELIDDSGRIYQGEIDLQGSKVPRTRASTKSPREKRVLTLPLRVLGLRDKGFFSKPKVSPEVYDEIKKTYYCQRDRVTMALIRLQKNKELRKATKVYGGKKMNAYVW